MKERGMIGYHPEQLIPHDHILRYSFKERLNHWIAAGSFIYLMLTGLALIGKVMLHIYLGVFAERGAFGSVIRGDVSLAFAKRYHPGWYKEIVGETERSK